MARTPNIDLREDYQRNYLINGAMEFSQRGTSFSSISDGTYSLDRFRYTKVGAAVHTVTQDTDVPTLAQAGFQFNNSMRLNLTTPDASVAAGDFVKINQFIEGYNWAQLAGKTFTFSFWVKATLPGTYCVAFVNDGGDRSYVAEYNVDAAGVWEKKSVTVSPSPETGTWNYVNGRGLEVIWTLASGSTFQTTAGAWQSGLFYSTANQVNGVDTGASDFRIAGAMITEGSEALPFRRAGRNITEELMLCQRYYTKTFNIDVTPQNNTNDFQGALQNLAQAPNLIEQTWEFSVTMRALPTVLTYGVNLANTNWTNNPGPTTSTVSASGRRSAVIRGTSNINEGNVSSIHATADAEL